MEAFAGLEAEIREGGLHVLRVGAAVWMLPFLNGGPGTRLLRIGLALVLGISVALARSGAGAQDPGADPVVLIVAGAQELMFGFLLGWVAGLALEAMKVAGTLISSEMGLTMANQVDPTTNTQMPVLAHFMHHIGLVLLFVSGGHAIILSGFVRSFELYPVGSIPAVPDLLQALLSFSSLALTAGLRIAAPIFFVMVVVSVCIGFLAKMAPQLHVLEASFPIRILAGLILLILFLPVMVSAFDDVLRLAGGGLMDLAQGGV